MATSDIQSDVHINVYNIFYSASQVLVQTGLSLNGQRLKGLYRLIMALVQP